MSSPRFIFTTACALVALAQTASAIQILINPTKDTFVSSKNPDNNYGKAGALLVNANSPSLTKGEFDSLLEFDLSSAKSAFDLQFGVGDWVIQSIQLQLTTTPPNNGLFNSPNAAGSFSITWMNNNSWGEGNGTPSALSTNGGVTYNTLSSFLGSAEALPGTLSFPGGTSGNNTYTLGTTSDFLAAATAGNPVSLLALPADSVIVYTANSEDNATPANHPVLTITAEAPEPGTTSLLLGGMAWGLLRRRRRAQTA